MGTTKLINQIATVSKIVFFLHDQTIIRQDALPDGFFFIIEGEVDIFQESQGDYKDYDYFEEKSILENPQGDFGEEESENNSPTKYPLSPDQSFMSSPSPSMFRRRSRLSRLNDDQERSVAFDIKPMLSSPGKNHGDTIDSTLSQ